MKSLSVKLGVILIGLAIFSNIDVWGADYKFYYSNEKYLTYYDTQSITRPSKNVVRVWLRWDLTEKGVLNWVGELGKRFENLSHLILLMEMDCAEKKNRSLTETSYDNKGDVIISGHSPSEWRFITPESMGEALYKEVCK